jgi:hypothetical protein
LLKTAIKQLPAGPFSGGWTPGSAITHSLESERSRAAMDASHPRKKGAENLAALDPIFETLLYRSFDSSLALPA